MATRLAVETFHPHSPLPSLFWKLPYETRRLLYHAAFPVNAHRFSRLRRGEPDGYAVQAFDRLRCIFIHIPKTAGMSVVESLFGAGRALHKSIVDYKMVLTKAEFEAYFKFAFVRNPWDRALSAYTFLQQGGYNDNDKAFRDSVVSRYGSFNEFIVRWMNPDNIFRYGLFVPQYVHICGAQGEPEVDFIGRFENLERDFDYVAGRLGAHGALARKNTSRTSGQDFRRFYSDESRKVIAALYSRDVEILGYSFDE
jgi:sulfotransferase famil protein